MPDLIKLSDYQDRRHRRRVQNALDMLYLEVLDRLREDEEQIDPEALEEFFVSVIADHLMSNFATIHDLDKLADRYNTFESHLRQAIYHRIAEFRRQ